MPRERRLQRRGFKWCVRVVVLAGIRDQNGKRELVMALGASDVHEAASLARLTSVEIDALFNAARAQARHGAAEAQARAAAEARRAVLFMVLPRV